MKFNLHYDAFDNFILWLIPILELLLWIYVVKVPMELKASLKLFSLQVI